MTEIITLLKDFLLSVQFYKWYEFFISVVSSLAAEIIFSLLIERRSKEKQKASPSPGRAEDQTKVVHRGVLLPTVSFLRAVFLYAVLYVVFLFIASYVYAIVKGGAVDLIARGKLRFTSGFHQYRTMMLIVPLTVKAFSLTVGRSQKGWRVLISLLLTFLLVGASALVTYPTARSPVETLVLEQFQTMPFPFVTRMYEPDEFWGARHTPVEPAPSDGSENDEAEPLPDGNAEGLSFRELMHYTALCWSRDRDLAVIYLNAAYDMYMAWRNTTVAPAGTVATNERFDPDNVGLMWYYKASEDDSPYEFGLGGDTFASVQNWVNAARCYRSAYTIEYEPRYAEQTLEMYWNASNGQLEQDIINEISWFLCQMQGHYVGSVPHLEGFLVKYPEDEVIKTVWLLRKISASSLTQDDQTDIESLSDTPKANLIRAYYQLLSGADAGEEPRFDTDDLNGYFPEDILNLAWLTYLRGDYGKAARLCTEAITKGEEDKAGETVIIPDAYLLIAELFLQDEDRTGIEGRNLVDRLQSVELSFYDDDSRTRFGIDALLVASRVGAEIEVRDILSMSRKLFHGESAEERLIQATVAYETGDYGSCIGLCRVILDMEEAPQHRALFLQADAFMALADRETAEEVRDQYLLAALDAMKTVESDVEDDYVNCLRRMHTIYDLLDDDENRDAVNKKLQVFN